MATKRNGKRYHCISNRDRRLLRRMWVGDPTKKKVVNKAVEIFRGFSDVMPDDDTSEQAGQIGLMVGKRDHMKTADGFLKVFDEFLLVEASD